MDSGRKVQTIKGVRLNGHFAGFTRWSRAWDVVKSEEEKDVMRKEQRWWSQIGQRTYKPRGRGGGKKTTPLRGVN
jgi:hypothetical protein